MLGDEATLVRAEGWSPTDAEGASRRAHAHLSNRENTRKIHGKVALDSHYRQSIGDRLVVDGGVGGDCPRRTNRNGVGFDGWSWLVVVGLEVFFFRFFVWHFASVVSHSVFWLMIFPDVGKIVVICSAILR